MFDPVVLLLALCGFCLSANAQSTSLKQENVSDFDVIDTSADGLIADSDLEVFELESSFAEFEKWYRIFQSAHKDSSEARKSGPLFNSHDLNGDGQLTVAEFVPLAFALAKKPGSEEEKLFRRLDKDNDGLLTRQEVEQADEKLPPEIVHGLFLVADVNRDGQITKKEYEVISSAFDGQHSTSQEGQRVGMAQSLMAAIDSNPKDGKLGQTEVLAYANKYNTNKVSSSEISAVFQQLDTDRDAFLSIEELQKLPERMIEIAGIRLVPNVSN